MPPLRPMMTDAEREALLCQMMAEHKTALVRMAYLYLGDLGLAEDAVQETFLKAYAHLERFRGDSSRKTWLMRIAINTCKDIRRTAWFRARRSAVPLDAAPEQGRQDDYADSTVLWAVMALSPRDKQVILLRYYQNMPVAEVAKALGVPVANAASRLNRARAHLKDALKGWYFDEE